MNQPRIYNLECAVCGESARGRQWYNRDLGFGVCKSCADRVELKHGSAEVLHCYGERGVHFDIQEGSHDA